MIVAGVLGVAFVAVLVLATMFVVRTAGESDLRARIATPPQTAEERLAAAEQIPTLAIIPFLAEDGSQVPLDVVEGITLNVTNHMFSEGFRVAATGDVNQFREKDTTAAQVGETLGVRYVLFGTVGGTNGEARVDVVLHDVVMGSSIFRGSFYGQVATIAGLNVEVVNALMVVLENVRSTAS